MFGYVTINKPDLTIRDFETYHSYYCGLCRDLHKRYGRSGQLTLSYDMTFLALLLSALYEPEVKRSTERCLIHPVHKHETVMTPYTEYAADMTILLSYFNLEDSQTRATIAANPREFLSAQTKGKHRRSC